MKHAIAFLKYVMENYYWCDGGQEWTDKKGKYAYTEKQMYRDFEEKQRAARMLARPEIKEGEV